MAKRQKQEEAKLGAPLWMATFSDMVTLLLAFFVMLLSFSSIQESKFNDAIHSLKGAFGVMVSPPTVIQQDTVIQPNADTNEWQQMLYEVQQIRRVLAEQGIEDDVQLEVTKEGVSIQISTPLLFAPAQAELRSESRDLVGRLAKALGSLDTEIQIEGHTDNVPISSEQFPSNWELSSARATAVLKSLVERGLPPQRLAAVGYGEFRPIAPNDDPAGRRRNRRVEIFVRENGALAGSLHGTPRDRTSPSQ